MTPPPPEPLLNGAVGQREGRRYHADAEQGEEDEPRDVRAAALLQRFPITLDLRATHDSRQQEDHRTNAEPRTGILFGHRDHFLPLCCYNIPSWQKQV